MNKVMIWLGQLGLFLMLSCAVANDTSELSLSELTLSKIMSDPDWIGRSPQNPYWSDDGKRILFEQKIKGHSVNQLMQVPISGGAISPVEDSALDSVGVANQLYRSDKQFKAYVYRGDVLVKDLAKNKIIPVTQTLASESDIKFLVDGRLAFRRNLSFFAYDVSTGETQELVAIEFEDAPEGKPKSESFLSAQQRRLFDYVRNEQDEKQFQEQREKQLDEANEFNRTRHFYLGENKKLKHYSLSPKGDRVFVALSDKDSETGRNDNMPRFVTEDGYVENQSVRTLVGQRKPESESFVILDLTNNEQHLISLDRLDDIDDDPLLGMKEKAAKAKGETYESDDANRAVYIHNSYGHGIAWSNDGEKLAINLFAYDNKDRWMASVDFKQHRFNQLHRLNDPAWINDWTFNQMGWLNDNETFYYLSEQSGHSHLYLKRPGKRAKALTSGRFEVSDLTLTSGDEYMYYRANKRHPGIYEIYRVNLLNGKSEAITEMGGSNDYVLSPDESKLIIEHSSTTRPSELYWLALADRKPMQLTNTTSNEFKSIAWTQPQVIEVPSSHTTDPIYSRLYLPQGFDVKEAKQYPAVMFVHGAGYLQNAHHGWSGYFREFMFHTLLNRHGYIVLDMDYRASKGYGRDWRTAIYRQMGTPELEDLIDGKQWLVNNVNVDPNKVGIYGGSYGGFMAFMAMFKAPGEFAAGAALRPVTDWSSYNHGYTSNMLNTPEVDPEAYNRSSPIEFADGLQDPLLIAHGMVDDNVFFKDSVRLVQKLIELEKTALFETAIYPVEPHGFRTPSSWLDEYTRIFLLFEEHVK